MDRLLARCADLALMVKEGSRSTDAIDAKL